MKQLSELKYWYLLHMMASLLNYTYVDKGLNKFKKVLILQVVKKFDNSFFVYYSGVFKPFDNSEKDKSCVRGDLLKILTHLMVLFIKLYHIKHSTWV